MYRIVLIVVLIFSVASHAGEVHAGEVAPRETDEFQNHRCSLAERYSSQNLQPVVGGALSGVLVALIPKRDIFTDSWRHTFAIMHGMMADVTIKEQGLIFVAWLSATAVFTIYTGCYHGVVGGGIGAVTVIVLQLSAEFLCINTINEAND